MSDDPIPEPGPSERRRRGWPHAVLLGVLIVALLAGIDVIVQGLLLTRTSVPGGLATALAGLFVCGASGWRIKVKWGQLRGSDNRF